MRRDWDIVRKVLIAAEESTGDREVSSEQFPEPERALVAYNMWLLIESGLAEGGGREPGGMGPPFAFITRLRWEGHELLDNMRGDTAWNRIKATAKEKSVDLTVDAIKMIGKAVLERLLWGGP